MGLFSKLFGRGAKAAADAVVDTANGVADIVERWAPSDKAKHEMTQQVNELLAKSTAAARSYDPRTHSTRAIGEFVNVMVDAVSRLIRPGMTILIVGAVFGWWHIETQTLDPVILGWAEAIGAFWFGMRSITRDIPQLIKMLVELKRGQS